MNDPPSGEEFLQAIRLAAEAMREYRTPSPWLCVIPGWVFDLYTTEELAYMEKLWDCVYVRLEDYS